MDYMARALHLARRALGTSSPNPAVGAVLVKDGQVVGEGWTRPAGQAHAEVVALGQAGPRARGTTLYVSLEPCAHHGRTPPCVDAIVAAGVGQVHIATLDPSPWVDGAGRAALEAAGIPTTVGQLEAQARRLNEGYLTWVARGRPLVTAVYAMTLDGVIQDRTAAALGETARGELARLEASADRVVAGLGTLLADDPDLSRLGQAGVTSLLVRADAADLVELGRAELADKLVVFVVPRVGGAEAVAPALDAAKGVTLGDLYYERLGDDLMVVGYTGACPPADN